MAEQKEKDISLKKDDILRNYETWFHQGHRSVNIRHLYLGKVFKSRGKLEEGEFVIVSVIESKKTIENEKYTYDGEDFTVVYKCWGEISVAEEEKTLQPRWRSIGRIKEIANFLKGKENKLFEKHSNLEMVRVSQFRMNTKLPEKEENGATMCEPCIALYCSYKGVVPIGEEEFPAEMDGFPTDIREGFFHLHVNYDIYANSNDLLDPLRMGANISRNVAGAGEGTLGGFVDLNDGGVGFLTCAHVFHTADEMQEPPANPSSPVVQPSVSKEGSQHCGTTLRSAFPSSTIVDGVSVDATVVKLTERVPDRALFTDLMTARLKTHGFSRSRLPRVSCGGIRSMEEAQDRSTEKTLKCGMKSGLTLGELQEGAANNKFRNRSPTGQRFYTMYMSQLEIQKITRAPFSTNGDSGALVFQFKDPGDLKCIGMIVGGDNISTFATPITSVLEALSVTLKDF